MLSIDFEKTVNRWRRYGEQYLQEGRAFYGQVINNARTVAIFLLGFNITWLELHEGPLTPETKTLSLLSIVLLMLSAIMSLVATVRVNEYLNNVGEKYEDRAEKLTRYIIDTGKTSDKSYPNYLWRKEKITYSHFSRWHGAQLFLLACGVLSSTIIPILFLLN